MRQCAAQNQKERGEKQPVAGLVKNVEQYVVADAEGRKCGSKRIVAVAQEPHEIEKG